jgi:hypothetical protein
MDKEGTTCNKRPYQYNINRKKREVSEWEGLESDEEEVEDLCAMESILRKYCAPHMREKQRSRVRRIIRISIPDQNYCGTHDPMCD